MEALACTLRLSAAIAAGVMGMSLLAAYVLAALLQGRISEPILALAETARAVSTRQDYSVRSPKFGEDELGALTDAFNQMLARIEDQARALRASKEELQHYATELEQRVEERTHELQESNEALQRNAAQVLAANKELDAFAYSVSHDLRAPLRSIDGFSQVVLQDYADKLDEAGRDALQRGRAATQRLGMLIDDLLKLARITRGEMRREPVDLSGMVQEIVAELQQATPDRQVEFAIAPGLRAQGDARLLRVVLENLLPNSWKYTAQQPEPRVEFGSVEVNGGRAFFVRDKRGGRDLTEPRNTFRLVPPPHS